MTKQKKKSMEEFIEWYEQCVTSLKVADYDPKQRIQINLMKLIYIEATAIHYLDIPSIFVYYLNRMIPTDLIIFDVILFSLSF